MNFVWDEQKRARNLRAEPQGHGLDFASIERLDLDAVLVLPTHPGTDGRPRRLLVGPLDGRLVTAVVAPLGTEALSLISLRPASRKERRFYHDAQG